MSPVRGLIRHQDALDSAVVRDLLAWGDDPELAQLLFALQSDGSERTFFNRYAEALIARHLVNNGCTLRVEVATPSGRTCDFEVTRGDAQFYLHVKRLDTDRPERKQLTISSRLRYLEQIERPYIVNIGWHEGLTDDQMQFFVRDAAAFIRQARVGDEHVIRDEDRQLGRCRIIAPWPGSHVSLAIGLPSEWVDDTLRMRKLLKKAYSQFMPQSRNVILICSSYATDSRDFESALLGTHVERWDRLPPQGRRVAHGRDADGFWHDRRHASSRFATWFRFQSGLTGIRPRLWVRPPVAEEEDPVADLIGELFDHDDGATVHQPT